MSKKIGNFQAFDALKGFNSELSKVEYNKNKISKPIISDDQKERLNLDLLNYFVSKSNIVVKFYSDGYILLYEGYIKKIDIINNCILFKDKIKIPLEDILEISA